MRYVCMKMHEHVTCKFKCIIGSAQSKPTSTQHSNEWNFKLIKATPIPKICTKISLILNNPKVCQKSQKLGQKIWNAWEKGRNQHTRWRKMILRPKIEWGGSLKCLRDVLGGKEAERIERNESEIARRLYIESS